MEYTHDNRHCLPSTLEPPTRPDEMMTDPVVNNSAKVFDRSKSFANDPNVSLLKEKKL